MDAVICKTRHSPNCAFGIVPSGYVFQDALAVISLTDFGTFALLSSSLHEAWAWYYGSTLGGNTLRYTPSDCFETFPFPLLKTNLEVIGDRYQTSRQCTMVARQEGLTKTYNRFHDAHEHAADIAVLRSLHVEMDQAVAAAYGWPDLDLGHGFHETKQGLRYTISEAARREVLDRLLALNHERYAEEVRQGLHEKGAKKAGKGRRTPRSEGRVALF